MAPLVSLLSLFLLTLSTTAVASPHIPRHVHSHGHRAPMPLPIDVDRRAPVPLPQRKRSLNKRCSPRPGNSSSVMPSSTAPINIAPAPSLPPPASSVPESTSSPASSYLPPATSDQAPASTSSPPPPPATSSPPAASSAPPPAQTSSSSNSNEPSFLVGTQTGQGTFYETGLGACGITNSDGQNIAAVSEDLFDAYPGYNGVDPNTNPVCGKSVTVYYQGKSVSVTITDRCTGCKITDLDMSPNAFDTLAAASIGRIDITWDWD